MSYERYKDWWDEALDDFYTAKDLYKLGRYSKVCYFCHQACEKAVKALLMKKLRKYETIHSVAELLRRIRKIIEVPNELIERGEILDRFYIPTRYPNAWPYGAPYKHYTAKDAEMALEYASMVMKFVEEKLEKNT